MMNRLEYETYQRQMREQEGYDPEDEEIEFLTPDDKIDLLYWGR